MRVALIPLKIRVGNIPFNLRRFASSLMIVKNEGVELAVFPETVFTGYITERDSLEELAEPVPGPITQVVSALVRSARVYTIFGTLEVEDGKFYDTAVFMGPDGRILAKQRKLSEFDPFEGGDRLEIVETPLGRLSILICGDLFNDGVLKKLDRNLDFLIVPMARSFDGTSPDLLRWLRSEREVYRKRAEVAGVLTMYVNLLEEGDDLPSFGGAMIVSREGDILAESPHGSDEILFYDIE